MGSVKRFPAPKSAVKRLREDLLENGGLVPSRSLKIS